VLSVPEIMARTSVSVVITVFNEEQTVDELLTALGNQIYLPSEIIIVDGGSTDRTLNVLKERSAKWKLLKVFSRQGNRSIGRNYAVDHSKGKIIAFTDAGCIPEKNWLAELTKPFADPKVQVVSGYYRGLAQNIFQKCLIPYVLVMPDKAEKSEFYPSTRSMAIRRQSWNQSQGFDPDLSHNEDYAYAHKLKKLGLIFTFAPDAVVNWIPRKNLKQAAWMFFRFALGDIQARIYRPQVKKLFFRTVIAVFFFFLALQVRSLIYIWLAAFIIYLLLSVIKNYKYVKDIKAIYWLPIIQLTADVGVLFGSAVGLVYLMGIPNKA
jgi:glycosyltransferase involved in cell wall biosynthesis